MRNSDSLAFALAEALALLRERKALGLVVHRLDRLARDLVLQEQPATRRRLRNANALTCSVRYSHR